MHNIGDFFKKILGLRSGEIQIRSAVREAVSKNTSLGIPIENITFQASSIVLKNINQADRSEIFIKKNSILRDINILQGSRKITDIR